MTPRDAPVAVVWRLLLTTVTTIVISVLVTSLFTRALFGPPDNTPFSSLQVWRCAIVLAILIPVIMAPAVTWRVLALVDKVRHAEEAMARLALTDELTGLLNRRGFHLPAQKALAETLAANRPVSALVCDIDKFKSINDTQGHDVGDLVIRRASDILRERLTKIPGLLCRHGGDEFGVLLPGLPGPEALKVAQELCANCAAQSPAEGNLPATFTISIGLAESSDGATALESLLRRADAALYQAKQLGRNRVSIYGAAG